MKPKEILIVPKLTKFEWDLKRLNLTESELSEFYKKERVNADKIIESHQRQKQSLKKIKDLLKDSDIIERDKITRDIIKKYELIISFGGDNHFQYVSHFLEDVPLLGINSDPERSEGALTSMNTDELEAFLPLILEKKFNIEKWTRLKISIDGKEIDDPAISEIYIGEERRFNMSRHVIKLNGATEEQKGSGLIITTGTGSTGWYNSASRYLFPNGNQFNKNADEARFILAEPYKGRLSSLMNIHGEIKDSQEIEVISLSDTQAFLSIDSLKLIKLREGAKIKVRIGKPLAVVRLNKI